MDKSKLTVRVPCALLENAKRHAAQNQTTLTGLIEAYLKRLPGQPSMANAPIVRRLSGSLSNEIAGEGD